LQDSNSALGIVVALLLASGSGHAGTTYCFQSGAVSGTVWVVGDDARLELDPGEGTGAGGQASIWKAGGKQVLILNTKDRTYFDEVAYLSGKGTRASLATLRAGDPFMISGVDKIQVELLPSPREEASGSPGAAACRPVSLKLSYELKLRLKMADVSIPARVEGSGEYCLVDALPISKLPFGHGLEILSGIPKVDAVLAERLASLKGVPIRQTLTVKRQIEGGELVSASSALALSEVRATAVSPDRFEVPRDYRYQEPVIVGPIRQER